jgi:hypothetical protein
MKSSHPFVAAFENLPLSFESNQGQAPSYIRFVSRGEGYTLSLTGSGAILRFRSAPNCGDNPRLKNPNPIQCAKTDYASTDEVRMTLTSPSIHSSNSRVIGEDELPGKVNYFIGSDPLRWRSNLPTYAKVRYASVYPGIDLVYYGNQHQLEYDFVVAPQVSPAKIQLSFSGEKQLNIDANGDLTLHGSHGSASFHKPVIYQQKNGKRQLIPGSFRLSSNNTVSFSVGNYDQNRALIIDPVLTYSTYLGGSGSKSKGDQGNGIAVDSDGNAYVVGTTYSTDFPVSSKAFQPTDTAATSDSTVFVTKLNPGGSALLYSTYLGGSAGDNGYGIAVDPYGNAYVTGATYSTDFPVTCGAFQTTNKSDISGGTEAFITKLDPTGSGLVYSTFLGGTSTLEHNGGAVAQAIAVGSDGDAYVTGYTWSPDFPVSAKAFQPTYAASGTITNAFVTRVNYGGTGITYSTYLGGSGGDYSNAIAVDAAGDAYVAGETESSNFPTTADAFQITPHGSTAFVTEINPKGTDALYSTYLGGSGGDSAQAIAVDSSGFAYIAGTTHSSDFPVTAGVLEGEAIGTNTIFVNNGATGFVTKLSKDGSAQVYSTYLEGVDTSVTGLAVDASGATYITGSTLAASAGSAGGFQATEDALPTPKSQGNVAFLVKLDPSATVLNYATALGGTTNDGATSLAIDSGGNVYVTGFTQSTNFPLTSHAFQRTNKASAGGGNTAFVSKFALAAEANQTAYPTPPASIPTSLSIISQAFQWDICDLVFEEFINLDINAGIPGPPPTGTIEITNDGGGYPNDFPVYGSWGSVTPVYMDNDPGEAFPQWTAQYYGDSVYQGSTISGSPNVPNCTSNEASMIGQASNSHASHLQFSLPSGRGKATIKLGLNSTPSSAVPVKLSVQKPKFTPPPAIPRTNGDTSQAELSAQAQTTTACLAPSKPPLVVTVHSTWKSYGAPNPTFTFTVTGLLGADTVTITPQTTATATSPVGSYPITVTASGADAVHYNLVAVAGTLSVRKVLLNVVPSEVLVTYGQTPAQPTAYTFSGFFNGDTASVVSGAPVLSTTVTSTTPVGYYRINFLSGTLTAENYYFPPASQAGAVHVTKAPLTVTANNLTMPQGGPIPTLTYAYSGFVNGETPASALTGTPQLATTATTHSQPGRYPIYISTRTLGSVNYHITAVAGVLTVTP